MNGYGGNTLRVNLTTGQITKTPTPPELVRDYVGGRGFNAYRLYTEVPQGADPLGPENKLFISNGPLTGLLVPGGGKCDFTTKSPLTGGYASASIGGHFNAEMKYAGLDTIILEGSGTRPVYLFIDDDRIELPTQRCRRVQNEVFLDGRIVPLFLREHHRACQYR